MVEEMLVKREGKKFRSEGLSLHYNTSPSYSNMNTTNMVTTAPTNTLTQPASTNDNDWTYPRRDGSKVPANSLKQQNDDRSRQDNVMIHWN